MLSQVPASFSAGWTQMSLAGTLVGLEPPAQPLNLELKPYAVSSLTTDRAARVPFSNDGKSSAARSPTIRSNIQAFWHSHGRADLGSPS
jgi:hypothetical protein